MRTPRQARLTTALAAGIAALALAACGQQDAMDTVATPPTDQAAPATNATDDAPGVAATTSTGMLDQELAAKVKQVLTSDPTLKEFPIDIAASEGVVTLHGAVGTPELRTRAIQLAHNVPGVQSVKSNLQIVAGS